MAEIDIIEYRKSLSELCEILKHIPIEARNKIPDEELKFYENNRDFNYKYIYDQSRSLTEQKLMDMTIMLIANIYINYWAENKEKLQLRDKKILYQIEEQKKIYNTNDLFKKIRKITNLKLTSKTVKNSLLPKKKI